MVEANKPNDITERAEMMYFSFKEDEQHPVKPKNPSQGWLTVQGTEINVKLCIY